MGAERAVKGEVGFVTADKIGGGVDDLLVEIEDRVVLVLHASGQFGRVGV